MAIAVATVTRSFRYNSITLADPAPDKTPDQVMRIFGFQYPELLNAVVEGPVTSKGVSVYTFKRAAGSKGVGHHAAVSQLATGRSLTKISPVDQATPQQLKENKQCSTIVQAVVNNRSIAAPILPGSTAFSRFG